MTIVPVDRLARQAMPWVVGGVALAIGLLVYLFDRPAGHASLMPNPGGLAAHRALGWVGGWLPSFVHPLAFSLFCSALLPPRPRLQLGVCGFWFAVNAAFEVGQHPQVRAPLADALRHAIGTGPIARAIERYFQRGTFDVADLLAAALGAALAAVLLHRFRNPEGGHHEP